MTKKQSSNTDKKGMKDDAFYTLFDEYRSDMAEQILNFLPQEKLMAFIKKNKGLVNFGPMIATFIIQRFTNMPIKVDTVIRGLTAELKDEAFRRFKEWEKGKGDEKTTTDKKDSKNEAKEKNGPAERTDILPRLADYPGLIAKFQGLDASVRAKFYHRIEEIPEQKIDGYMQFLEDLGEDQFAEHAKAVVAMEKGIVGNISDSAIKFFKDRAEDIDANIAKINRSRKAHSPKKIVNTLKTMADNMKARRHLRG